MMMMMRVENDARGNRILSIWGMRSGILAKFASIQERILAS